MKKISNFISENLHWLIVAFVAVLCAIFIIAGTKSENGSITLDGQNAQIEEYTEKFIENANDALYRIMNEDAPTDEATTEEYEDGFEGDEGLGGSTTLDTVKQRRLPDGNNDGGKGWQCSKYTAYLATGKKDYSSAHPDYGPVNGKNVAAWLVQNFGWEYTDTPVEGAIGSGGFNTTYGHTAMYLYPTGTNTAMVNDANYTPLTVFNSQYEHFGLGVGSARGLHTGSRAYPYSSFSHSYSGVRGCVLHSKEGRYVGGDYS